VKDTDPDTERVKDKDKDKDDDEEPEVNERDLHMMVFSDLHSVRLDGIKMKNEQPTNDLKAAWVDPDDQNIIVNISNSKRLRKLRTSEDETLISGHQFTQRLRSQFEKLQQNSSWAQLSKKQDESQSDTDSESEETKPTDTHSIVASTLKKAGRPPNSKLPQTFIDVIRLKDANQANPHNGVVQAVQFHPNGQLMLTAALDKSLRLFNIDGVINSKVEGVNFQDLPIFSCNFSPDGTQVVATGRRKYFYVYDLPSGSPLRVQNIRGREEKSLEKSFISPDNNFITILGNDGNILLLSMKSKQLVDTLKSTHHISAAAYSPDSRFLYTSGVGGVIHQWDMSSRRCVNKFIDEGSRKPTCLAFSPNSQWLASGSESGVVNIFDTENIQALSKADRDGQFPTPTPSKSLMNLTTATDLIKFNFDSQLMAFSSRSKKDAFRLVHVDSKTVFSNWPTPATPLHRVSSFDFSPNGAYLAAGNAKGLVLLYCLSHYKNA